MITDNEAKQTKDTKMKKLYFTVDMINGLTMIEKPETDLNLNFCFDNEDINYYLENMSHDDTPEKPFNRVLCCDLSVIEYLQAEYGFKTDLSVADVFEIDINYGFEWIKFNYLGVEFYLQACTDQFGKVDPDDHGMNCGQCNDSNGETFTVFGIEESIKFFMQTINK